MSDNFRCRVKQFAELTDTHGVKFLSGGRSGCGAARRVTWCAVLVGAVTFLTYFFWSRVDYFLQYETTTKVLYEMDTTSLPLPPVTVCPYRGGLKVSHLTSHDILNAPWSSYGGLGLTRDHVVEVRNGTTFIRPSAAAFFSSLLNDSAVIDSEEAERYWSWSSLSKMRRSVREDRGLRWRPLVKTLARHPLSEAVQDLSLYDMKDVMRRAGLNTTDLKYSGVCRTNGGTVVECPAPRPVLLRERVWCHVVTFTSTPHISTARIKVDVEVAQHDGIYTRSDGYMWTVYVDYGSPSSSHYELLSGTVYTIKVVRVKRNVKRGPPYSAECGDQRHVEGVVSGQYSRQLCVTYCTDTCHDETVGRSSTAGCTAVL